MCCMAHKDILFAEKRDGHLAVHSQYFSASSTHKSISIPAQELYDHKNMNETRLNS